MNLPLPTTDKIELDPLETKVIIKAGTEKGLFKFLLRAEFNNGMIYDTAIMKNLHGYCFDFDAVELGLEEGHFKTPLDTT